MIRYRNMWFVLLFVVVVDQISKHLILANLTQGEVIEIIPKFFNLILTYNPGAAFGMFADLPDVPRYMLLALTTLVALGAVLYFFLRDYKHDWPAQVALAMIVGGAVGNIIDRFRYGMVVDFLDFYIAANHWPAFNVADSAICFGVIVLFFRKPGRQ